MIIGEILLGLIAFGFGVFSISTSIKKNFTVNPVHKFGGVSETRQRAISLLVGVGSCLLGLVMLFQGFCIFFVGNTN